MRGGDVEEAELVRALLVVEPRLLHRIAGVDQIDEVDALHGAPILHVEARDDADLERHPRATRNASAGSMRPSYSARPQITPAIPDSSCALRSMMSLIEDTPPEAITGVVSA